METFNVSINLLIALSAIFSLLIEPSTSSSADLEGEGDSSSKTSILVIVQGQTTTINCASFFANHDRTNNNNSISNAYFYKWTVLSNNDVVIRESSSSSSSAGYNSRHAAAPSKSNIKVRVEHKEKRDGAHSSSNPGTKPWLEAKENGDLTFHSPTKSVDGLYSCASIASTGRITNVHELRIRVVKQSHFDTEYRIIIGVFSVAAVLLSIVVVYFGCRFYKRRRKLQSQQYVKAKTEEIVKVPTITVLDVYGQKVEESIF